MSDIAHLIGEVFYQMPRGGWEKPLGPTVKCHIRLIDDDQIVVYRFWVRRKQRWVYESVDAGLLEVSIREMDFRRTSSKPLLAWLETKRWRCPADGAEA